MLELCDRESLELDVRLFERFGMFEIVEGPAVLFFTVRLFSIDRFLTFGSFVLLSRLTSVGKLFLSKDLLMECIPMSND